MFAVKISCNSLQALNKISSVLQKKKWKYVHPLCRFYTVNYYNSASAITPIRKMCQATSSRRFFFKKKNEASKAGVIYIK